MEEIEYVVTLKDRAYLEGFYLDMAASYAAGNCPARSVTCSSKRPLSRNTHYFLTLTEAEELSNDPRVLSVSPVGLEIAAIKPLWTQAGTWHKGATNNSSYNNWGIYRVPRESNTPTFGTDGTQFIQSTVNITSSGKNVDIIVVDGHIDPDHPEFAINSNGTGGSRVVQLDWYTLNSTVGSIDDDSAGMLTSSYVYTPYSGSSALSSDNNHGAHVAGVAAGNTNGWARDANIYNINPYSSNPNGTLSNLVIWDYIRAFHLTKEINPETGFKNPTICNCSYGSSIAFPNTGTYTTGEITSINYRGTVSTTSTSFSDAELIARGIYTVSGVSDVPYFSASVSADIEDAIADGIIVVGAAGNESFLIDTPSGQDYNNSFSATYNSINYTWYANRGTVPSATPSVICVGAVSALANESKATFSNCGPRVDLFAPGRYIMSSLNNNISYGGVSDNRDINYYLGKLSGTSMASPQVCGIVACILELYPRFTQAEVYTYLLNYAKSNKITATSGGDLTDLQGAPNKYLFYYKERNDAGSVYPKVNFNIRPSSGQAWPRPKIYRYGR